MGFRRGVDRGAFFRGSQARLLVRRSVLFFIVAVIAFGLFEPGITTALAMSNNTKKFDTNFKLDPLKSEKAAPKTVLTEPTGSLPQARIANPKGHKYEDTSKRTDFTSTYVNNDGTHTMEYTVRQQNYKDGSTWKKIDNTVTPTPQQAPAANFFQVITNNQPKAPDPVQFKGKAGSASAEMNTLSQGLKVQLAGKTITMKPVGAKDVKPVKQSDTSIVYKDAWPNVDLEYELRGESVKEIIILKNKNAQTNFDFNVTGGKVINHPTHAGELTIEGLPEEFSFTPLSLALNDRGIISEQHVNQSPTTKADGITVKMDNDWMKAQPASAFPMRIDPSVGKDTTSYWMFKSDGYSCGTNCYANIGAIYDNGWKNWRTYIQFPFSDLAGKKILSADLHGYFQNGVNADTNGRWLWMGHAPCISFNCQGPQVGASGNQATDFDIDFTGGLQQSVNNSDWGTVWSLWGEEGAYKTIKSYYDIAAYINYDSPTPVATPIAPADKQVVVDTQPTLSVNSVSDPDGPVQYQFKVATNPDASTGAVINSAWVSSPTWSVPDGVLQDGTTYYWRVDTKDSTSTGQVTQGQIRSFRVDLRTGKDSTQSYDTVGPVGIDLATGNASLSASTHSIKALGGSIGLNLSYNTPNRAKKGLTGEYWNLPANYSFSSGAPTSTPTMTRRDQNINFNWDSGSPDSSIQSDWFYTRWTGQFIAPVTGSYQFGGNNDDNMHVWVNNNDLYNNSYSAGAVQYGSSITLQAGQVVPIRVEYMEVGGGARAQLYVKGAVNEQIVPQDWLYTNLSNQSQSYGLTGRYYTDNANAHDLDAAASDPSRLMLTRRDSKMNLNFGSGAAAQGLQTDNFMARWTGYITVPTAGSYTLGAATDDGIRIKVNTGSWQTAVDSFKDQAATVWGTAVNMPANTQIPIQVDWFEHGGGASIDLMVQGNGYSAQEIPATWLTPDANALPGQWKLGVDVDGNVNYDRLRVSNNSVILEDSTGSTHEYTYTNGGYKPPVNEDGNLTKNGDNSFTFIDTDGRTYIFDATGKLTSLTSPTDDRQPAALKYTYAGDPSRLTKIEDGTTSARYATVYYKGINDTNGVCDPSKAVSTPSTFFGLNQQFDQAPNGMLCAFTTGNGETTNLYYIGGNIARIVQPGNEITDYAYDSLGRIISVRDSMAADAIAAGVRTDNTSVITQLLYDSLGRTISVRTPAATTGGTQVTNSIIYTPGQTDMRVSGASEPNGYTKRVQYDNLLRTISETDVTGKTTTEEWDSVKDLQRSTTDTTGLKSTTIYDGDDRATDSYGPAPASWYGADWRPTSAYVSQVPHSSTGYDESINGPAVSYMAVKQRTSSVLPNGGSLQPGQDLRSPDGRFDFVHQTDSNIVLYGPNGVLWASNTTGRGSTGLYMQGDGNLVLYGSSGAIWASNTSGGNTSYLRVQNDGNAVIYNAAGSVLWQTNTGGQATSSDNATALTGTPVLNTTNLTDNSPQVSANWTSSPVPSGSNYWGARMTGKLYLPTTGNWTFRIVSDNGVRMSIDDNVGINDWVDGGSRSHPTYVYNNTSPATTPHRLSIDYYHLGGSSANFTLYMTPAGGTETTNVSQYIKPDYNLKTSTTVYDTQLGNTTSTTQYSNPAYGQVSSTTLDPTGLNYQSTAQYETPGTGFLRQTNKTLAGGATTTYQHYGSTDTVTVNGTTYTDKGGYAIDPCSNSPTYGQAISQGGQPKGKTDPTGRTSQTIYNYDGDVIATRFNSDNWTCTSYDSRGRVTQTTIPGRTENGVTYNGRTTTDNYAVGGNPLISSVADDMGTITVETDLLGRTIKYTDATGKVTTNTYDLYGKLTGRSSPVGAESYDYDQYNRLIDQKLDGVTFTTISYDDFSRIQSIQYPAGISLQPAVRDSLGRVTKVTYSASGQEISDSINRSVSGLVLSGTENGVAKSYTYDKADRLLAATIGANTFSYGFGAPDTSCSGLSGNNPNAGKDSNRTSYTLNNNTTTYCYDMADHLIGSSDNRFTNPQYDTHGNTTSLGDSTHKTQFAYDASDRNVDIKETTDSNTRETIYQRDATDRIVHRTYKIGGTTKDDSYYGFTGNGDTPSFLVDTNGTVTQKYLNLPGGVRVTIKPLSTSAGSTTYSLSNMHGDTMATVNADGTPTIVAPTGPFGERTPEHSAPVNAADGTSNDYLGSNLKASETDYLIQPIQMGARLYIPELGRFLQMDPVEGGTPNDYVYPPDPVNQMDLNGQWSIGGLFKSIVNIVTQVIRRVTQTVTIVSTPKAQQKKAAAPIYLGSKQNSFSGQPYQQPSSRELDAYQKSRAGRSDFEKRDLNSFKSKQKFNEKVQGARNNQKRGRDDDDDKNNPTAPPNLPPNPYSAPSSPSISGGDAAVVGGGLVLGGGIIWWSLKLAAPLCGPGVIVCAVAL